MAPPTPSAFDSLPSRRMTFGKGQIVYGEGEPADAMFRVESGCIRLQVDGLDGERQIVSFLFPGDLFGFCLDARNTSAEAVVESVLGRYALETVFSPRPASAEVAFEVVEAANRRYGDLAHHVEKITHLPAAERVLWFLDWLARRNPRDPSTRRIALPMNFKDAADFLGLKPESLSRALGELQAAGRLSRLGAREFRLMRSRLVFDVETTTASAA